MVTRIEDAYAKEQIKGNSVDYDLNNDGVVDYAENADKLDGKDASEFADVNHTHDDRYYTETEVDDKLATKSDVGHTHNITDVVIDGDKDWNGKSITNVNEITTETANIGALGQDLDANGKAVTNVSKISINSQSFADGLIEGHVPIGSKGKFYLASGRTDLANGYGFKIESNNKDGIIFFDTHTYDANGDGWITYRCGHGADEAGYTREAIKIKTNDGTLYTNDISPIKNNVKKIGTATNKFAEGHITTLYADKLGQDLDGNGKKINNVIINAVSNNGIYPLTLIQNKNATFTHCGCFYAPNLGVDQCANIHIGKSDGTLNTSYIGYVYEGENNLNNYFTIGFWYYDRLFRFNPKTEFYPGTDNTGSIGTTTNKFAEGHITTLYADKLGENLDCNGKDVKHIHAIYSNDTYTKTQCISNTFIAPGKLNGIGMPILKASFDMVESDNSFCYVDLTSVSDYTIQEGDVLEYDIYWETPSARISVDFTTSDNVNLRDRRLIDQNGVGVHTGTLYDDYALNKWYHRKIVLPEVLFGKTIDRYDIACESDEGGTKTAYLRNIVITDGNGNIRKVIYMGGEDITYAIHLGHYGSINAFENTTERLLDDYGTDVAIYRKENGVIKTTGAIQSQNSCSCWARIDLDGTLLGNYNVANITKISTGVYQITFSTPMANANYCAIATCNCESDIITAHAYNLTTDSFYVKLVDSNNQAIDAPFSIIINGGL
jgi:GH24 family phage-related lysozyme (muramidase)